MGKSTTELEKALQECSEFKNFYDENRESFSDGDFVRMLNDLMNAREMKSAVLFMRSGIGSVYGYQILNGIRRPKREKVLCLSLGLELTLEETQKLLHAGGYAPLYVKNTRDCVVTYAICNRLNVEQTNAMLFEYDEETLI